MRPMILAALAAFGLASFATGAGAQEGLATSGSLGGHNTIQQAPSGGREGNIGTAEGGSVGRGEPTPSEREAEKRANEATQICKGC